MVCYMMIRTFTLDLRENDVFLVTINKLNIGTSILKSSRMSVRYYHYQATETG